MEEIILSQIRISDLKIIIADAVDMAVVERLKKFINPDPVLIDTDEMCLRFGITKPTLQKWRDRKEITYVQLGDVIRYDFNQVVKEKSIQRKK